MGNLKGFLSKWIALLSSLSYTKDGTAITYTYDTGGMRLSKNVNGLQYTYLYRGGLLVQETRGSRILDYFYDANGQAIAVRYKSNANNTGTYYYYAYNWRGDILGLYNADGSLYCTYSYDAWGNILSVKDSTGHEITVATDIANLQSLKYRGYVYDRESGLYYLQSRYYDPVTHRFINADGLISTGTGILGYNMFAYCDSEPINRSDATGSRYDEPFYLLNPKRSKELNSKDAARDLFHNTTITHSEDEYSISIPLLNISDFDCDINSFIKFHNADTLSTFRKLTKILVNDVKIKGQEDYVVSPDGEAHLFGEMLLHFYGYNIWDTNDKNSILSSCSEIDLTIRKDGNVNDQRPNKLIQFGINRLSEEYGKFY